ncbi:MAG: hypothetical protein AB8C84_06385 [Oligoflexales bacterium]
MKFIKFAIPFFITTFVSCDKSSPEDTPSQPKSSDQTQSCDQQRLLGIYDSNIIGEAEPSKPEKLVPSSEPQSLLAIHLPQGETTSEILAPYIRDETLLIAVPSAQIHVDKSDKIQNSLALAPKTSTNGQITKATTSAKNQTTDTPRSSSKQTTKNFNNQLQPPSNSTKIDNLQKDILSAGPTYEIAFRQSNLWKELKELGWQESIDLSKFRNVILKQVETSMAGDRDQHATEFAEYTKITNSWKKTWEQYAKDQLSTKDFQTRLQNSIENLSSKAESFQKVFLIDRLIIQEKIRQQYELKLATKVYSVFTTHWHKILTTVAATMGITGFVYNFIVLEKFKNPDSDEDKEDHDSESAEGSSPEEDQSTSTDNPEDTETVETSVPPEDLGSDKAFVVEITPTAEATAHPIDPETGIPIPEISIPLENRTAIGIENQQLIKDICQPKANIL